MVSPGEDGLAERDGDGDDVEGEDEGDIEEEGAGVKTGASSAVAKPFMPPPFTTAR